MLLPHPLLITTGSFEKYTLIDPPFKGWVLVGKTLCYVAFPLSPPLQTSSNTI